MVVIAEWEQILSEVLAKCVDKGYYDRTQFKSGTRDIYI